MFEHFLKKLKKKIFGSLPEMLNLRLHEVLPTLHKTSNKVTRRKKMSENCEKSFEPSEKWLKKRFSIFFLFWVLTWFFIPPQPSYPSNPSLQFIISTVYFKIWLKKSPSSILIKQLFSPFLSFVLPSLYRRRSIVDDELVISINKSVYSASEWEARQQRQQPVAEQLRDALVVRHRNFIVDE